MCACVICVMMNHRCMHVAVVVSLHSCADKLPSSINAWLTYTYTCSYIINIIAIL